MPPRLDWNNPYPMIRRPVLARNVVSTSQPLAAQAGLRMLLAGGNAVDAALATAITLPIVEPISNGLGSDAFAIVWDGRALHGLNASGRSPLAWTPDYFRGQSAMPHRGWNSVTVPGAVSGWVALSRRFGRLPFEKLFEPAIEYAAAGFPVSPFVAQSWASQIRELAGQPGFAEAFMPGGRAPVMGERFGLPAAARTLEKIAATLGEALYRGELAERIARHAAECGAAMTTQDLGAHACDWCGTLSQDYRGLTVHEIPPNGQGIVCLMALGILSHFDIADLPVDCADSVHLQIEAVKLAFADAYRYVADPRSMAVEPSSLLQPDYLGSRARLIDMKRAQDFGHGTPPSGGTVYLATADASGMMVSMIQSNFSGFGSGVVVPDTGISLQNRGAGFSLRPGHPNEAGPGKRPFHTIIPGFVTRAGKPFMTLGLMGGSMQPQGHTQLMVRIADYAQNPQAAIDAPRFRVVHGLEVNVEPGFPQQTLDELTRRGHRIVALPAGYMDFGCSQLILRLDDAYLAASDARRDSLAVGF
ncbi:MAG: gamma-glutamyltransferase [Betaproteobacteria bacterium RIFCSPLOWO2_02_FULL_65_24]|nr:MAG: gamma-glutamyltransferase [Betaproteobacteria bacterium RIFCSPLOWO2_02_FULL_65_24]OGA77286.1 MAG: gamma-glutamyltransferase [Betaproteobacteria bacterium RIFCSPLOWO2_12_FULL_66_14]